MNSDPVTELRLQLWRTGYSPLPLSGKKPQFKDWQTKTEVTEHEIKNWSVSHPAWTNTGALTRRMPTLDIDLLVEPAAIAVEALAREYFEEHGFFLVRIGQPPKRAVILRTDKPFPKIVRNLTAPSGTKDKIEILAEGQQVVVAGIHPDTNREYVWHGGNPWTIAWSDLPYVDEATAIAFADAAEALLVKEHGYKVTTKGNGADDTGDGADWNELIGNITRGESLHDSITALAAKFIMSGMGSGSAVMTLRGLMDSYSGMHDERWQARRDEIPRAVKSAKDKLDAKPDPLRDNPIPSSGGLGVLNAGVDTTKPSPREWLLGNIFARNFLSSLFGDGGVGKTALRYAQYMSLATGRTLSGEHVFQRCRVLIVSLEDNMDELRRRIWALRIHYHITAEELDGWLFLWAPGAKGGKLMELDKNGNPKIGDLSANLEALITELKLDFIGLDPFIKTHSMKENSNDAVDLVAQVLTDLMFKYNIGVDVPHHVSKPGAKGEAEPGDANRGRGASAMKDAARLVYTLNVMTKTEAEPFQIDEANRFAYIRMDKGKVNIAPPARKAVWFHLVGVSLGNENEMYPHGDEVQAVEPWFPPDMWKDVDDDQMKKILADIDKGLEDGSRYSDAQAATTRAAWRVVVKHIPKKTEKQAKEIINTWVKNKVLLSEEYHNPKARKSELGLKENKDRPRGEEIPF